MKLTPHPQREDGFYSSLRKILIIMKLSIFFLLLGMLQVSASVFSQPIHVTFPQAEITMGDALATIEESTEFRFFYRNDQVDLNRMVKVDRQYAMMDDLLDNLLDNSDIRYRMVDNNLVILTEVTNQLIPIKGKVTDEQGKPLPFVSVAVKGSTTGTTTDENGEFTIEAKKGEILVFSMIGYGPKEVVVGDGPVMVSLVVVASVLDEVQIIGYGTTTKKLNTGTVATVKAAEIKSHPVTNVMQALQGQVSGVSMTQTSSGVGSPIDIIIRGQNSFSSGTNPMIIVDGVVVNSDPGGLIAGSDASYTTGGSNTMTNGVSTLNFINPNDIESIDILKDADATSIYGSRGSNGVILITTKKAILGETKFTINASTGVSSPTGMIKRMGTADYLQMRKDAFAMGNASATSAINPITPTDYYAPDLNLWDQTAYTDWNEYTFGNPAPVYNLDAQMTGGNKLFNYLASVGYFKKYDVTFGDPYQERLTGRMVIGHTSADNKFVINLSSIFGLENQKFSQTSLSSVLSGIMQNVPNYEMYNDDGSLYIPYGNHAQGSYSNPVPIQSTSASSKTGNVLLSADVSYEIIKGLRAKMLISYTLQDNEYHMYYPSTAISAQTQDSYPNPYATHTTNTYSALNIEPMLTYDTKISKGALSLLAGGTWLDRNNSMTAIQVQNPGSDALLNSYANGNPTIANNNEYYYKFNSIFGRATYNWNSKYLVNVTYRRDGSSRFGPENKFGNFGSAGLGWIFSEEKFISNTLSFLSFGKLRGSYGTTGSDNIGDYKYTSLLESDPYSIYVGQDPLAPAGVPNPEVQWEKTTKLDIGIELGFFKNRILLNTTWYRTSSDNLLVDKELPSQTGYFGYTGNFEGTIQNTGMEFQLTTQNLAPGKKLTWKTSFNISFNENILTEFPGLEDSYYKDSYEIGRAIPSGNDLLEMPYNFTGIDPATGLPQFKDLNEDGIINYLDSFRNAAWIGTALPTTWGGLGNYFTYKGFGFDFFIQFSNKTMTAWNFYGTANGRMMNPSEDLTGNYWKQPGDETKYPRLYTGVPGKPLYTDPILRQYPYSSANLVRGTYYRLKNVQFTYTVPANILQSKGVENLMFYIRGENLAVYTKHKIYKDPELFWNNAIPMLRTFIAGVQLTF